MTALTDDKPELPIAVDDTETIVRALVTPAHFDKGKLKTAVFRPKAGESSISVMRRLMGDNFCKNKSVDIGKGFYVGLLSITAKSIRSVDSSVTDSRDIWLGHADLDHGFVSAPANDPATGDDFARMTTRCQELRKACKFYVDAAPAVAGWNGPPLKLVE